ncbi:MAG TPA: TlpA disulfide reductase family protein [Solirubrobacteraceae bacterium]|jgi:cytochrome c biogenesis protein CcmG/thiol:disulfide interchange protein DsbE|nr:TlpA disulfide reductase family protein [Solirubrobacteraceae bacterium]
MTGIAPARLLVTLAIVALIALLAVGLIQLASSSSPSSVSTSRLTLAQVQTQLAGSPAPLAALHAQAGQLLSGGAPALRARLAALHGYPLVINKWASWCVPCQSERIAFQHASTSLGRSVAFLGIDSGDTSLADGSAFLRALPVAYPSYYDQSGRLGTAIAYSSFTPVTVFYDRAGRQYIHQGPYPSAARLERDVRRYALDS